MKKINFKKIFAAKPKQPVVLGQKTIPYIDKATKKSVGSVTYYYMNSYLDSNDNVMVLVVGHVTAGGEKDPNRKEYKFKSKAIMFNQATGEWTDRNNNLTQSIEAANEQAKVIPDVYSLVQNKIIDSSFVPFDAIMNYAKRGVKPKATTKTTPKGKGTEKQETEDSGEADLTSNKGAVKINVELLRTNKMKFDEVYKLYPEIKNHPYAGAVAVGPNDPGMYWVVFPNREKVKLHKKYLMRVKTDSKKDKIDHALEYYESMKNEHSEGLTDYLIMSVLRYKSNNPNTPLDDIDKKLIEKVKKENKYYKKENTQNNQHVIPDQEKDKSWIKNIFKRK